MQTSLLEARLLTGDAEALRSFQKRFAATIDPQAFFVAKTLEMRQRHNKFENTPYSLEPNCKESPGGLRDLQVILWVANAAGLGKSWDELARSGLATAFEARQIKRNEALLSLIRARLHVIAGPARGPAGVRPADGRGRILRLPTQVRRRTAASSRAPAKR